MFLKRCLDLKPVKGGKNASVICFSICWNIFCFAFSFQVGKVLLFACFLTTRAAAKGSDVVLDGIQLYTYNVCV